MKTPRAFLTAVIPGVQRVLIRGRKLIEEVTCRVLVTLPITLGKVWEKSQSLPLQDITWMRVSEWTESCWSMRAGVAGEAGRRGGCASLMTWKRSRLATEYDGWGGADLHNLIQTTLPPRFAQILNHQGSCDLRVIYVLLMTVDVSGLWHKHETTLWMQIIKMQSCRKYSHLSVRGKCKHKVKNEMLLDLDTESICFLVYVNDERWMLMFLNTLVWSCIGLYSHAVCAYDIGETPEVPRTCFLWPLTAAHCNVCILKYCWHVQVIIQK